MAESVTFWLDNKNASGVKVAEIGQQTLVLYREKYYLVEEGAARMKGSRPLHYSQSSLPAAWKKAMRGIAPATPPPPPSEDATLPRTTSTRRERTPMNSTPPLQETHPDIPLAEERPTPALTAPPATPKARQKKNRSDAARGGAKPGVQGMVIASCPYCDHHNELPLEKGKSGKPFFTACSRCRRDFAVRFVAVTVYQAQVAAFT